MVQQYSHEGPLPEAEDVRKWDANTLLGFLSSVLSADEDKVAFRTANIDGTGFLGFDDASFAEINGLSLESCKLLAALVRQINASSRKLLRDKPLDVMSLEFFADDPRALMGNKISFLMVHKQLTLDIELAKKVGSVSENLEDYCNPEVVQHLPFLCDAEIPYDRFPPDPANECFTYYGRSAFREIYAAATSMRFKGPRLYFIHGTLGAGKSYMLAALCCLLRRNGKRVVFLPDCRAMLRDTFKYLQAALRLTFIDHPQAYQYLCASTTTDHLIDFCYKASNEIRLLFVIDQVNALDPQDDAEDRYSSAQKMSVRALLDRITSTHLKLASSSGNYQHGLHDTLRQTGEKRLGVYGGLTEVRPPCNGELGTQRTIVAIQAH